MSRELKLIWAKFMPNTEPTFLSNTIFAFACEDVIIFIDIHSGEQILYRAVGQDVADGVSCIGGHKLYKCFAVAERCFKPRILIHSYPDFGILQTIEKDHSFGQYAQVKFSHTEYLIALTKYPGYKLKMWNYRSGILLAELDTGVIDERLELRLNNFHPFLICQYARESSRLMLWEVHSSGDKTFLINRPTVVPFMSRNRGIFVLFGIDGIPYLISDLGDLYSVTVSTGVTKLLWEWPDSSPSNAIGCVYKGGFLIFGVHNQLKFIKKVEREYFCLWTLGTENTIKYLASMSSFEIAIMLDIRGAVLMLQEKSGEKTLHRISDTDRSIKLFELIYPSVEYIVILTFGDSLQLLEIRTGDLVSTIDNVSNLTVMRSHPDLPLLFIGRTDGVIDIYSYFEPKKPSLIIKFSLGASSLTSIRFSSDKSSLAVKDNEEHIFVMMGLTTGLDVWHHFIVENIVLDYAFCEADTFVRFLFIISNGPKSKHLITREVLILTVFKKDLKIRKNYVKLHYVLKTITPHFSKFGSKFFAVPKESRQIFFIEMKDTGTSTIATYETAHQVKDFFIYADLHNIVTFGQDGIVCVFDMETKHLDAVLFGTHRLCGGITKACFNPNRRYCIVLSKTGSLKCFENSHYNTNKNVGQAPLFDTVFETKGLTHSRMYTENTWLSMQDTRKIQAEYNKFKTIKHKIISELNVLKVKIGELLNHNEEAEDLDQLEVKQFNLHTEWETSIKQFAKAEREKEEKLLRAYIEDQNRITKWIISFTWDKMEVKCQRIRGIFSTIGCENFALVAGKNYSNDIKQIELLRSAEIFIDNHDRLYPWMPRWQITRTNRRPTFPERFLEDIRLSQMDTAERLITLKEVESRNSLSGTSTYKFIVPNGYGYDQLEVISYMQMFIQQILAQDDMLNLKQYFNKTFVNLIKLKQDQVAYVKERNARLRHIQSEIKILAQIKGLTKIKPPEPIMDPEYCMDELPESVIKVEEHEVSVKPYISPSRQKILDAIAYQEELRRLALLADDFRERALMAMMDGVLERHWEDEIKKDPPLPDCIRDNKDPYEYTKEDLKSVQDYEEKLKFVRSERERYNTMLHDEMIRVQAVQDEQIMKFNLKCGENFLLKLKIDAAVRHEELRILRTALFNEERIKFKDTEDIILSRIEDKKILIQELNNFIEDLEKLLQECRARYEQLQTRDRSLDKQFKLHFGESAPSFIVDQAYKIFKKRPKWPQRAWATSAILTEMSTRIAQKNSSRKGIQLPEECYEFLHLIDSIDNYNLAPNAVDHRLWDLLCRMRRHKMESEFRVKACGAQLAEAEASLNALNREMQAVKVSIGLLDKEMQEVKQKYKEHLENRYIQLVMPLGLVEVDLQGKMTDFEECLLLSNTDVEDINEIIKRAGRRKLAAMKRLAVFRRKILYKEWEHKVHQMTLQDMKMFLGHIEGVKVTIEMKNWLLKKKSGKMEDLSNSSLRKIIDGKVAHLAQMLAHMDEKINDVVKKIEEKKVQNRIIDKKISEINIEVATKNLSRDVFIEEKELRERKERMDNIRERGRLVRKVQANHAHILELITMLELQRLRTYPTLAAPKSFCS